MMMAVVQMPNGSYLVESRKRPLEEPSELLDLKREKTAAEGMENGTIVGSPPPGQLLLKILVPGYAAGAIIGKGGQIIVQLQKETGAIIKLSKAKDFYPGTQDRVVLIQGTFEGLTKVHNTIIDKVHDFPVPKDLTAIIGDRAKQVKIIVPNTTAGLVIGKGGATIKAIMEESGAKVQLSQKPDGLNLQERVITLKGEKLQLISASNIITSKIKDDPQSASCPNISYAGISGPVANANPTGSPYATAAYADVQTIAATPAQLSAMIGQPVVSGLQAIPFAASPSHIVHGHPLQQSQVATASTPGEIAAFNATVNTLANYGYSVGAGNAYGHHLGLTHSVIPAGSAALSPANAQLLTTGMPTVGEAAGYPATAAAAPVVLSNNYLANMASAGYFTGHQFLSTNAGAVQSGSSIPTSTISMSPSPVPATAMQVQSVSPHAAGLLSVEKSTDGLKETIDLSVPESLVGAILGKGGKTLVEYQEISGTRIQISKKGEYVPGTRNRRVSISGKPPGPQTAQFLITQRLMTVQTARAQQAQVL
uniref:RNA-binding protein Nova-1-like isoform X2 n=1 Tax=Styela clava TaxID=7725 RepID=UPI00193A5EA1|nr:RNA-binding protein Nova-1-like isoform X2 [Styela clava]